MSPPPDTILVKRKRGTEDGPVDFLRVEGNKRHRLVSGDANWVYQRKQIDVDRADHAVQPTVPSIQPTQEGDENRPVLPLRQAKATSTAASKAPATTTTHELALPSFPTRRFHLSRSISPLLTPGGVKKRTAAAVFVEREVKEAKKQRDAKVAAASVLISQTTLSQSSQSALSHESFIRDDATDEHLAVPPADAQHQQLPYHVKQKRPSARSRPNTSNATKPTLPPSLVNREGVDMDQLARDMDAYTVSQINTNLDRMDKSSAAAAPTGLASGSSPARKSKFKPKAPALRYAERHPEHLSEVEREKAAKKAAEAMDIDEGDSVVDDEDYVMETYERVPASRMRDQAVPAHRIGLLVFDTEPDRIDFFYGEEGDSEDEFPEDDEDENAENYYTADYPDEDLDWDDEFDRNPYHFVNHSASDTEEYDVTAFVDADEDDTWGPEADEPKDLTSEPLELVAIITQIIAETIQ
ncbi:hypothetical protein B0H63DRAFT_481580 [Podospora didyma]|uniref:Transcription factor Iwr1 domain-containing protein n=1 Tax=Podospora didyma TaxID=330526 RepID=A0AAE0NA34_9PEZI|nr:hypothetical protein B0H63DRAFT_481580 [Podospora didyma]